MAMHPLAAHVHLVVVDEDVVFLDVAADRYLCLPGGRDLLAPAPGLGAVSPAQPELVEALRAAGLLAATGAPRPGVPARPTRDVQGEGSPALSGRDAWRLLGALCDAFWRYRGRPLREITGFAAARTPRADRCDPAEVARLARLYGRVVVWLPLPRKCLIRSFVLLRFLQRSGQGARWVFGVRTWPFSAHCWLQIGEVALDDHAERLVAYQPIFAVS